MKNTPKKNYTSLFLISILFIFTVNVQAIVYASERPITWSLVCNIDYKNPQKSLISYIYQRSSFSTLTKEIIRSPNIHSVINKKRNLKSTSTKFNDLLYFMDDLITAANYKYLINEEKDLKILLDTLSKIYFNSNFMDRLNKSIMTSSTEKEIDIKLYLLIKHFQTIARMGELYYEYWEMSGDNEALHNIVKVLSRLRKSLSVHQKYLFFKYGKSVLHIKSMRNKFIPRSINYFYWEYSSYLEISKAQISFLNRDEKGLKAAINEHVSLSRVINKELKLAIDYVESDAGVKEYPFSQKGKLIKTPEGQFFENKSDDYHGANKYLLFGKPQRILLYQKRLLSSLLFQLKNDLKGLYQLNNNLNKNFLEQYNIYSNCDPFLKTKDILLQGDIVDSYSIIAHAKNLIQNKDNLKDHSSKKTILSIGFPRSIYIEALELIRHEVSPVLWHRILRRAIKAKSVSKDADLRTLMLKKIK